MQQLRKESRPVSTDRPVIAVSVPAVHASFVGDLQKCNSAIPIVGQPAFRSIIALNGLSVAGQIALANTQVHRASGCEMCALRRGYCRTAMVRVFVGTSREERMVLRSLRASV